MDTTLTVPEVAKLLEISESSVRRLIDRGELPAVRITDWRKVSRDDLEKFAKRHGKRIDWSLLER